MGSIWTTPGIAGLSFQFVVDGLHKARRCNGVGVDDDDIFAIGALYTLVTALTWPAVLLEVIMQIKDVCVFVANILAGNL